MTHHELTQAMLLLAPLSKHGTMSKRENPMIAGDWWIEYSLYGSVCHIPTIFTNYSQVQRTVKHIMNAARFSQPTEPKPKPIT